MERKIDTSRSSNVRSVAYDDGNLFVEFTNGSLYKYKDVPEEVFDSFEKLSESDSFGKHFIATVRNNFPYEKVRGAVVVHK